MISTTSALKFVFAIDIMTSNVLAVTDESHVRSLFPILPVDVQRFYYRSFGMDVNQMSCVTIGVLSPAMVTLKNILEKDVKQQIYI